MTEDTSRTRNHGRAAILATAGLVLVATAARWQPSSAGDDQESIAEQSLAPAASDLAPGLVMPGEVNAEVDRWMQRYMTTERVTFEEFLSRESVYGGMIRQKLRDRGMPEDLLYLAMIESGFSNRATSQVQASGLWQFMGPTAREYGLRIGDYVDERRDPLRATDAALDYLQSLHDRFGSWYLAAAAYNAGPNRVARALREQKEAERPKSDAQLYWEVADRLPSETRSYVSRILAAILLAKEAGKYGFQVSRPEPFVFDRVWVPGSTSLDRIAQAVDLPVSRLKELNPQLIRGVTPPGTSYGVRVPPGSSPTVLASLGGQWALADDD